MTKLEMLLQEAEAWAHEVEDDHGETGGTRLFRRLISALSVVQGFQPTWTAVEYDQPDLVRVGWNKALERMAEGIEDVLASEKSAKRHAWQKNGTPANPSQAVRLRKIEVWCDLMGLDIQRVVSLLGTTALAGYYDSVHSTKKLENGTVILNRADIAVMLEQEAQTSFGRSADMVLAEYRDGRLAFSGQVAEARGLLILASLLPKDDPLHVDL